MTTRTNVLRKAASYIGYTERGNNITQFWERQKPSFQGGPWCAAFVVDVLEQEGNTLLKEVPLPYYTPSMEAWARKTGRWKASKDCKPGDLLIYGTTRAVHTGFLEKQKGSYVQAIEGNTGPGNGGSQTDGGGVYRRVRPRSWVRGGIDMSDAYTTDRFVAGTGVSIPSVSKSATPMAPLDADGVLGPNTVRALQKWLAAVGKFNFTPSGGFDGDLGKFTISALQVQLGRNKLKLGRADGEFGPRSARALERFLGLPQTQVPGWYPGLIRGLQRFLNEEQKKGVIK